MINLFPVYWSRTPLLLTDFAFCFLSNIKLQHEIDSFWTVFEGKSSFNWEVDFAMIISTKTRVFGSRANVNTKSTKEQYAN